MPRSARITFKGGFYHIFNRGIQKFPVFQDEEDFERILTTFTRYLHELDCQIYAYSFMPNHYHVLLEEHRDPIAKFIGRIFTSYGLYFNRKYHGSGPLFQDRFKSKLIQRNSYFLELSRYIHCNPVKAGLVRSPMDYPYGSLREYFGKSRWHLVSRESVFKLIGENKLGLTEYLQFVQDGMVKNLDEYDPFLRAEEIVGSRAFISHRKNIYR